MTSKAEGKCIIRFDILKIVLFAILQYTINVIHYWVIPNELKRLRALNVQRNSHKITKFVLEIIPLGRLETSKIRKIFVCLLIFINQ